MTLDADMDMLALFQEEAAARLGALGDHVLQLEKDGPTPDLLTSMFREAHTIKGSAAVVGLEDVAREAHVLEELLDRVRAGTWEASAEVVDTILSSVDRLFTLTAVPRSPGAGTADGAGVAGGGDASATTGLAGLAGAAPAATGTGAADAGTADDDGDRDDDGPSQYMARPTVRRETARVAVERLDDLVRISGEAAAANLRLAVALQQAGVDDPLVVEAMRSLSGVLVDLGDKTLRARMMPIAALSGQLRRAVRDLARKRGKEVRLEIRGDDTELDRNVHEQLSDALVHLVRNAVDHGIERPEAREAAGKRREGTIVVHAMQLGARVIVSVTDDGAGIDTFAVRQIATERLGVDTALLDDDEIHQLLFRSGLSTATTVDQISGRGIGLDVVHSVVERLRGRIEVQSTAGAGTSFRIVVPVTLAVLQSLIVEAGGRRFAVGMHSVRTVLGASTPELVVEGGAAVRLGQQVVPLVDLTAVLGTDEPARGPIVVVTGLTSTHAFRVDALHGQRELVMKSLPPLVPSGHLVVGGSAEPDGSVLLVLDAEGLIEAAATSAGSFSAGPATDVRLATVPAVPSRGSAPGGKRAQVLVVDDALTVRELQRSILERAGFAVRLAVDGVDGLEKLGEGGIDLVLTDVEMPRMDGLEMTRTIRSRPQTANLPVVVLTTRAGDDDRQAGMDAGADAYIVKSQFNEASLLGVVENLLGAS